MAAGDPFDGFVDRQGCVPVCLTVRSTHGCRPTTDRCSVRSQEAEPLYHDAVVKAHCCSPQACRADRVDQTGTIRWLFVLSISRAPPPGHTTSGSWKDAVRPSCDSPNTSRASRLVQAMSDSAWLVKTQRAPFRHRRDARVYGHGTTAMHKLMTPSPGNPRKPLLLCNIKLSIEPPRSPSFGSLAFFSFFLLQFYLAGGDKLCFFFWCEVHLQYCSSCRLHVSSLFHVCQVCVGSLGEDRGAVLRSLGGWSSTER